MSQHDSSLIDAADRAAIAALLAGMEAAWARSDADLLADAFSDQALFVAYDGSRLHGRTAIADFHRRPFATHLRGMRLAVRMTALRALTPDICIVSTVGSPRRPDGGAGRYEDGVQSYVCQRRGRGWRIEMFQNTPVRE